MKNQKLFNRTVDILVKALKEGKLEHGDCQKCAVGNIVTSNMYGGVDGLITGAWYHPVACTTWNTERLMQEIEDEGKFSEYSDLSYKTTLMQIMSTGYTIEELRRIESAFEDANQGPDGEYDSTGVYGLRNVYDELLRIHDVDITAELATAEEVFA